MRCTSAGEILLRSMSSPLVRSIIKAGQAGSRQKAEGRPRTPEIRRLMPRLGFQGNAARIAEPGQCRTKVGWISLTRWREDAKEDEREIPLRLGISALRETDV